MRLSRVSVLLVTCSLLSLTACGGSSVKETLGLGRKAPDEFKVVSRPPLSVPPQFKLRPPSSTAESPIVVPADKKAQSIIVGDQEKSSDGNTFDLREGSVDTAVTPVESASLPAPGSKKGKKAVAGSTTSSSQSGFMQNIGADKADPNVRDELVQKKLEAQEKKEEANWWNVFSSSTEKKEPLVNAKDEAERIKTNKAENKPVTEGDTPEVKDKDHGLLGNIFGW